VFLKGLCTSYLACLSFLCGEICKTERIKHTLGSCHSAKPKFWLSSPQVCGCHPEKCFTVQAKFVSQILHNKSEVYLWAETKLSSWAGFLCLLLKSGNPRIRAGVMSLGFALGNKGHVGAVSDVMFWRLKIQPSHQLRCLLYLWLPNCPNFIRTQTVHFVPGIFITQNTEIIFLCCKLPAPQYSCGSWSVVKICRKHNPKVLSELRLTNI
jgi:hypothetical protein